MATATLGLDEVTASQTQKEVTMNNAIAQLEGAVAKELSVLISTTSPVLLDKTTQSARYVFFTLDNHGTPPTADFILEFPAVARGLVYILNNTSYIATIRITGTSPVSPPTIAAGSGKLLLVTSDDVLTAGGGGGGGAFTDLSDVPTSYTGKAYDLVRVNSGESALEFIDPAYDVGSVYGGAPSASAIVFGFVANKALSFPASMAGSVVIAKTAATAQTDFDLQKNGVSQGTVRFAAAGTTATYVGISAFTLASGDRLELVAPGSPDSTLANLLINFAGYRNA